MAPVALTPATNGVKSEIGVALLPNQRHDIVYRKGTNYNILVVGESGSGKTTFINTLFSTLMKDYENEMERFEKQYGHTVDITIMRADIEEKGFHCRLTIIDTPGFGDYVNNSDCWVPIVDYVDDQHAAYLEQEQQPKRDNIDDMRVHVCLYFVQPTGHNLSALDIRVMKELSTRVNVIPVIAKADTLTRAEVTAFKDRIRDALYTHGISVYTPPNDADDEEDQARNRELMTALPFAIIGSDKEVVRKDGTRVKGRQFLWGVAEVENENHCDFVKLRNLLMRRHMDDLVRQTEEMHYETFRSAKMASEGKNDDDPVTRWKMKEDEENMRRRFTELVRQEENRFKSWEQKLLSERDRLNKDLEESHMQVKKLSDEVRAVEEGRQRY
ncbi:Septin [Gonapodya prolifera JEL478]|uniref:Septin n=1 Tax=Gonapodya prolifera (strain JEL478) TaxID=1344416 RepID=A0A139AYX2_GONPJ|nr:Septin [Gonapodya prolifera JEL478]|eukprot:KXS21904.1 Septin [Gonapodya prolifera JEL478]